MSLIRKHVAVLQAWACLALVLVAPVSAANAERSISMLRSLKNWLRSTMTQERLTHLAVLHCHQERVRNIDVDNICREFVTKTAERVSTFGKFWTTDRQLGCVFWLPSLRIPCWSQDVSMFILSDRRRAKDVRFLSECFPTKNFTFEERWTNVAVSFSERFLQTFLQRTFVNAFCKRSSRIFGVRSASVCRTLNVCRVGNVFLTFCLCFSYERSTDVYTNFWLY